MNETMNALAVTVLGERAELRAMPRPTARENEVVIKTWYSGVSVGTEMWIGCGKRNDYGEVPFVNGYQATGEVVEVGPNVTSVAVGEVVATFCNGAHSEYVRGSIFLTHRLGNPQSARAASLFVQPSVGANALSMANVNTGDTVLVIGQGLIGQCTARLARLRGAHVIVSDISPERLEYSRAHCADWAIDANAGAVSEQLRERFPDGVDVVLESTGFQKLLDDAIQCCTAGGRFVFEGWYPGDVQYNFQAAHEKQLRAFYPCFIGGYANQQGVIRLIESGLLGIESLASHVVSWRASEAIYNQLFTPQRDSFNGIIFDWTK